MPLSRCKSDMNEASMSYERVASAAWTPITGHASALRTQEHQGSGYVPDGCY